jgi:hypothetical protein
MKSCSVFPVASMIRAACPIICKLKKRSSKWPAECIYNLQKLIFVMVSIYKYILHEKVTFRREWGGERKKAMKNERMLTKYAWPPASRCRHADVTLWRQQL